MLTHTVDREPNFCPPPPFLPFPPSPLHTKTRCNLIPIDHASSHMAMRYASRSRQTIVVFFIDSIEFPDSTAFLFFPFLFSFWVHVNQQRDCYHIMPLPCIIIYVRVLVRLLLACTNRVSRIYFADVASQVVGYASLLHCFDCGQ